MKHITARNLQQQMDVNSDLMVINVLSPDYYHDCHIAGSVNVPLDQLEQQAQSWDKQKHIVVYCARYECKASANAYQMLEGMGFNNIAAYEGGTAEWKQLGLPIKGPCKKEYLAKKQPTKMESNDMKLHTQKFALASGLTGSILTGLVSIFNVVFLKYMQHNLADEVAPVQKLALENIMPYSWMMILVAVPMAFVIWYAIGLLFSTIYNRLLER